jgi:hypothetical protein
MLSPAPPNLNWTSAIDAAKIQKILIDNQKVEKILVLKNSNGGDFSITFHFITLQSK